MINTNKARNINEGVKKFRQTPIYIKRREHWYERLRYVIGEPIYLRDYIKGVPKIDDFIRLADMLHDKEVELKAFLDRKLQKKEKKIYF